jgi:hypothetical protein
MAGMLERRPSATITASGKASAIDITVSITVSGRPPHWSVVTLARPKPRRRHQREEGGQHGAHSGTSQGFQNQRGMQLATTRPSSSTVASSGRQCSAAGSGPSG